MSRGQRGLWARKAPRAHREPKVCKGLPGWLVLPVNRANWVRRGRKGSRALLGRQALLQGRKGRSVRRGLPVRRALRAPQGFKDCQAPRRSKSWLSRQAKIQAQFALHLALRGPLL